jgi:hypothetical protein
VTTVLGDGRLSLQQELQRGSNQFDILLVDAFAGDQVPWHLLTREALELFLAHLAPDGILAFHVSNPLPLDRLLAANLQALDAWALELSQTGVGEDDPIKILVSESIYVLAARDHALVQPNLFNLANWAILPARPVLVIGPKAAEKGRLGKAVAQVPSWTDERNSLSQLLWMKPWKRLEAAHP